MEKRFEQAGRTLDKELDRLLRMVNKEARVASRKGRKFQRVAHKRTVRLLRQTSLAIDRLAGRLEQSGSKASSRSRKPAKRRARR